MKILLVEDEHLAAQRLETLLKQFLPAGKVISVCDSIAQTVRWLNANPAPDIAFFDIRLGDGLSFDVFKQVDIYFPVVFTTAYDQYAIKAFQVNGLDYLLKPVEEQELERALKKFEAGHQLIDQQLKEVLLKMNSQLQVQDFKSRYLIKVGEHLKMVDVSDIAFGYSQEKANYFRTIEGRTYSIDQSLDQLDLELDSKKFHRISRKYIININAIEDMLSFGSSRMKLIMKGMDKSEEIIVSRDRVKAFKEWLED